MSAAEISAVGRRVPLRSGAGLEALGLLRHLLTGRQVCWCWVLVTARSHPGCTLQELLENEPTDQLCTAVRYQAMLAIAALRYQPSPGFSHTSPGHSPAGSDLSWEASPRGQGSPQLCPAMGFCRGWRKP